jgi:hypothetical protein
MLPVWLLTSRGPGWFAGRGRPPQAAARRSGLDELVQAVTLRPEPPAAQPGGTLVARTGRARSAGAGRRARGGR